MNFRTFKYETLEALDAQETEKDFVMILEMALKLVNQNIIEEEIKQ